MDVAAILALVTKGISVAEALIAAGQSAAPAFDALKGLLGKDPVEVTDADLAETERVLDQLIANFNLPLSPAKPGDPDYVPA